eukprot:c28562_g2_i1 orf=235-1323(+)
MDGNKDDALKCMSIGHQALRDGDKSRAYKFLSKARRLDPGLPLEELLSSLLKDNTEEAVNDRDCRRSENKNESEKNFGSEAIDPNVETKSPQETKTGLAYTREQADIVLRIKKTKDYYQILGLTKDCSAEEVRKAYRKVSLKVHPDKNKAPGAEEAFKAVSKAFACLSDDELRKRYDQYGPEETAQQHYARRSNGFHEEMFDADEIFNAFFFGTPYANSGFQQAHFVRTYGTGGQGGGGGVRTREVHFGRFFGLLQLLPILALFFISFFPSSREPVYSLEQVAPYQYRQVTRVNAVTFFVKSPTFEMDYPAGGSSRRNIEADVERDYREILAHNCRIELGMRYWNPSAKTPYCDRLNRFVVN